jgi:hypothetical protein
MTLQPFVVNSPAFRKRYQRAGVGGVNGVSTEVNGR